MTKLIQLILLACFLLNASLSGARESSAQDKVAIEMLDYLTDANGKYAGPSVEDNVAKMDTDHNGFADVAEVRAFLELKHGAGYQKALLDRWEVVANTTSCGTSFAKELTD
ncbi:MAG: hypothetical protein P8N23_05275 [Methylophilaceae bacterium]|jgi:hypothetical protein|nr:hypothetical protein [Methylophilaceae bacterium]MDG1453267.1 hypothetical protein [Methylophilaceae bacterium]